MDFEQCIVMAVGQCFPITLVFGDNSTDKTCTDLTLALISIITDLNNQKPLAIFKDVVLEC